MNKLTLSPLFKPDKNKSWNLTLGLSMPRGQPMICSYVKCGKAFSRPIELTIRTRDSFKTYYACPHCFSKVNILEKRETLSKDDAGNNASNCAHFVGYLKTRPKESPIPDECLTCDKILKCI